MISNGPFLTPVLRRNKKTGALAPVFLLAVKLLQKLKRP
jgi:hypothetical protein